MKGRRIGKKKGGEWEKIGKRREGQGGGWEKKKSIGRG